MKPFILEPQAPVMTPAEREAVDRVKRAGVKADESAILSFVRCVGATSIMSCPLREIRDVAHAF